MGYDLRPKNKKVDEITFGAFIWPIMLQECGMGYVLGYGAGITPASYVYNNGNNGSPSSNDGYRVTAFEAKAMAKCARGYASVMRFINTQYDKMTEEERENKKTAKNFDGAKLYRQPAHEDFIKRFERFATFAETSGGFTIN